ncbi:hypothetical protein [Nocardia sp. NPDC056000]|uniref:hypothetical protein n=1 Tax=Nocardia sp. NPDC056000 TaxID=3345674 RepID=UPI0035E02015
MSDADPRDPRAQEEIQEAVRRARQGALSGYMSEQDIVNAAAGYLGTDFTGSPGIDLEIRREVGRQGMESTTVYEHAGTKSAAHPPAFPTDIESPTAEPVFSLTVDHWLVDQEIQPMRGYAAYDRALMSNRYDPTCPSGFYRGYLTALVGLAQSVTVHDSLDHLQAIVEHLDGAFRTWNGTADETTGAAFALTNAWAYTESGSSVADIIDFLYGEIACIADCFALTR